MPAHLTASLCNPAALGSGSAAITTAATAAITAMEVAKMKIIIGSVIAAVIVGTGGYEIKEKITFSHKKKTAKAIDEKLIKKLEQKREVKIIYNTDAQSEESLSSNYGKV